MELPCVYNDVKFSLLYSYRNKEDIYVISSKSGNANYFCKASAVVPIFETLELFDGTRSVKEIEQLVAEKYPGVVSTKLVSKLAASKFVIGNTSDGLTNELNRNSLSIVKFNISKLGNIHPKISKVLYKSFCLLLFISLILIVYLSLCGKINITDYFQYAQKESYIEELLWVMILEIPCMILHETAHIIVGLNYQCPPQTLGFSLYFYFFPMYYILTPGIYLLSRKDRLKYHCAGIGANFIAYSVLSLVAVINGNNIFYIAAFSNLQLIVINLVPFNLSDGYFISSALLKKINLRLHFLNLITFQDKWSNFDLSVKMYSILSFIYIIILSANITFWIQDFVIDGLSNIAVTIIITASITGIILLFVNLRTKLELKKKSRFS